MKIKHPNFNHIDSSATDSTYVPEHLVRKHWSLQIVEIYHIVICLAFGVFTYTMFSEYGFLHATLPALFLIAFFSAALLSIIDDYRFGKMVFLSHIILISISGVALLFSPNLFSSLIVFSVLLTQGALVIAVVFLPIKNKNYYNWCKSITSKI